MLRQLLCNVQSVVCQNDITSLEFGGQSQPVCRPKMQHI